MKFSPCTLLFWNTYSFGLIELSRCSLSVSVARIWKTYSQWYMTFLLSRYRVFQFRDIDILLLWSDSFFSVWTTSVSSLESVYFIKRRGLRSYFETIKPVIYMRSRSLTAGSADRHAYTQNLLEVYAVMCVRACGAYIVMYRWSSMIFNHNRSKGLDFGFAERGKKS